VDTAVQKTLGIKIRQRLGLLNNRNLYWASGKPNFGDWIGPRLYKEISGQEPYFLNTQVRWPAQTTLSVGSILGAVIIPDNTVIWGSGILASDQNFQRPKKIHAVRGPRTWKRCKELGYSCPEVFGDPAILLSRFYNPQVVQTFELGIIPHYVDIEAARAFYANEENVKIIDVRQSVDTVVADILSCRVLVSSSLHGIILSHTYNRSCAWIEFSKKLDGDGVKFNDYFEAPGPFSVPKPKIVKSNTTIQQFIGWAEDSASPDIEQLREPLLQACPFPRKI
jgi:pyruvyltransferase